MNHDATIRRGVRNARYAVVPNHVFEDCRMSMEARWLLGYLLSKPDNWTVVVGDIIKKGNCGRDKARKMIAELVEFGYAEREQSRADGKFGASVLVIFDEPRDGVPVENARENQSVAFLPQTDLPATAKPSPDSPSPVKSAHSNNSHLENTDYQHERDARERVSERKIPTAVTADLIHRVQRFCNGQGFKAGEWKGWSSSTIGHIAKQFAALDEDERDAACKNRDAFLAKCSRDKVKPMPVANYFRDRVWMMLTAPESSPVKVEAPAYGPAWSVIVFERLLSGPVPLGPPDITREKRLLAYEGLARIRGVEKAREFYARQGHDFADDGTMLFPDDFEARQMREHLVQFGYPHVNALYEHSSAGHGLTGADAEHGQAFASLMEFVVTDSPLFQDWQTAFEENGWPWPKTGRMRGLYFPAGGPDQIFTFERAIRNDDAA